MQDGFLTKYFYVLRGHGARLAAIVGLFILMSMLDLLSVGLIGPFVGIIVDPDNFGRLPFLRQTLSALGVVASRDVIVVLGAALIGLFMFKGGMAYWIQRRIFRFSFSFRAQLVKRLVNTYLRMPYQFFLERNTSTVVQSVLEHTKITVDNMLIPSLRVASDALTLTVLGFFLCWISLPAVVMLALMLGGTFGLYLWVVRPRVRQVGTEVAKVNERVIRRVNESMAGIKEIRTLRIESFLADEIGEHAAHSADAESRFNSLLALPRNLMEVVLVVFVVLFSTVALLQGSEGKQLIAVLAVFAAASIRILPATIQISSSLASMNYSIYSMNSLYHDLRFIEQHNATRAPAATALPTAPTKPVKDLDLINISYAYPGAGREAITKLSMSMRRGQSIGLIGESGAGKTTLVDILLGLHPFDSGRFLINGIDVVQYGWNAWLDQVAYIPQNAFLADDTLEHNVAYGVPFGEIDRPRLELAIASAQLAALVARLPAGVNTVLGERGVRLSGGERQRVALARAFYHNRSVLVFDEATSALDADTERQVIEVMNGLYGEKTLIVIAHRLATVKGCDVIHKLHAGRIVSSGTFDEVIGETNNT